MDEKECANHVALSLEFHQRVLQYIRPRVKTPEDAEEIRGDVFVKVMQSDGPKDANKLGGWLFAIVRNSITDYYRKNQRQQTLIKEVGELDHPDEDETQLAKCLTPFLSVLPDKYQDVVQKVEFEGMSQKDYALSRGIPYSTAKSLMQRARTKLNTELQKCCRLTFDSYGMPYACTPKKSE